MFQRDYILRLIELMSNLSQRVSELMDELRQMRLLDNGCRRYCGLPLAAIEALHSDSLIELLAPSARLFASELLYTRATLSQPNGEELKLKSLRLLASMYTEGLLCELHALRLKVLKQELLNELTADDLMACAEFFFQGGEYADMKDAIFRAIEVSGTIERRRHTERGVTLLTSAAVASERDPADTSPQELREAVSNLQAVAERLNQKEKNERESNP